MEEEAGGVEEEAERVEMFSGNRKAKDCGRGFGWCVARRGEEDLFGNRAKWIGGIEKWPFF